MHVVQSIFSVIMNYSCDTDNTILVPVFSYSPRAMKFLLASIFIIQSKLDLNRANTQHRFCRHNIVHSDNFYIYNWGKDIYYCLLRGC